MGKASRPLRPSHGLFPTAQGKGKLLGATGAWDSEGRLGSAGHHEESSDKGGTWITKPRRAEEPSSWFCKYPVPSSHPSSPVHTIMDYLG